jgi:hypothetical protein
MLRSSLEPQANHAMVALRKRFTQLDHVCVRRLQSSRRTLITKTGDSQEPGIWLRIDRVGTTVQTAISRDGETWSEVRDAELEGLGEEVYVGIAAAGPGVAEFTDFSIGTPAVFLRGDANSDGGVDLTDAIFTLNRLYIGESPTPECERTADSNADGAIDVSDAVFTLGVLFVGDVMPPPYPDCGLDPSPKRLGCAHYPTCD